MSSQSHNPRRAKAISQIYEKVEPTGKIVPSENPWMMAPSAIIIMDVLNRDGAEARFIGGCVRDAILKRPTNDVDIATTLPPDAVTRLLEAAGLKLVPTGIEHGTVTVVTIERDYQITTLRTDVETDGRHAQVSYTSDWTADAARRDFRINTLSASPDGDVYDPFQGLSDLAHGRVRFVGNAVERIDEDVLRILRFFRMFAYFGTPAPNKEALVACRLRAPRLAELSSDRVREEIFKTLKCRDPAAICLMMAGENVFKYLLPEYSDVGTLRMLQWLEQDAIRFDSVQPSALRRLAALVSTDETGAQAIATRFNLSNVDRAQFVTVVAPDWRPSPEMTDVELTATLYKSTPDIVRDIVLIEWAGQLAIQPRQPSGKTTGWQRLIAFIENWQPIKFPLRGQDVLDQGGEPGPEVSALLDRVEAWWQAGNFIANHDACLARLKEEINTLPKIKDDVRSTS